MSLQLSVVALRGRLNFIMVMYASKSPLFGARLCGDGESAHFKIFLAEAEGGQDCYFPIGRGSLCCLQLGRAGRSPEK